MYDVDFSIASVLVLAFMLVHYFRQHVNVNADYLFFRDYLVYMLFLAVLDIVDVAMISSPVVSTSVATIVCSLYLAAECIAIAGYVFVLPVLIYDATPQEKHRWRFLMIPSLVVAAIVVFVNYPTGIIFTLGSISRSVTTEALTGGVAGTVALTGRGYLPGPANWILPACDAFYIIVMSTVITHNRRRIDTTRIRLAFALMVIATLGLLAQQLVFNVRISVFVLTLLSFAMYLGFQVPERRFDPLTGLLNRKSFHEEAERNLREHPDDRHVIVYANISEFKAINDLYGMQVGDEILSKIGHILGSEIAGKGVVGRLQGDHFACCVDPAEFSGKDLFERMGEAQMQELVGHRLRIVCGVYEVTDPTLPVGIMCDCARLAMKTIGDSQVRNYAYYTEDMRQRFLAEHRMSLEMSEALKKGQFEVYLQPVVDASSHQVMAAEALIRWNHPEKGMIPPGEFIPVFERNGLITELDRFVWKTVCTKQQDWQTRGMRQIPVSVNISAMDLGPDLGATIVGMVEGCGINSSLLDLEVTESAFTTYRNSLSTFLDFVHDHGFTVLMDDFGTGYSSLTSLKDAHFDRIKMDKEFIDHMMDDERSLLVVETTVELAGKLDMAVVAEGVETELQASVLHNMGVEMIQGYLFGKPMPISEFERRYLAGV